MEKKTKSLTNAAKCLSGKAVDRGGGKPIIRKRPPKWTKEGEQCQVHTGGD